MRERLRWKLAYLLDRLPGQCWADLATWAMNGRRRDQDDPLLPFRPIGAGCRADFQRNGTCYCAKLATDEMRVVRDA